MPSSLSVDQFLHGLELSGILPADDVSAVLRIVDVDESSYPNPESIADYLTSAGMLTHWQAEKLLDGKHKGFLLGNYLLKNMLGQGAMGTVYLAEQMLMKRRCAVKLLHPTRLKDPELLERFLREGRAVATTDHPNIVRAYELSRVREGNTDLYFLAMELATGRNLQDVVEQDGTFSAKRVAHIMRQVALGLAHAHQKGVIHRDIKPTNLMLDDTGLVKILDLGLARFFDDSDDSRLSSLHDSTFLGTAGYLAPEQAYNSRDVDARADLYSLGATAFYLLCGRSPFNEGTVVRRLMESQSQQPPLPHQIRADIPEEFSRIVVRLLQPIPADRFQSADELIEAIEDWLSSIPGGTEDSSRIRRLRSEAVQPEAGTANLYVDPTVSKTSEDRDREDSRPSAPIAVLIPSDSAITRDAKLQAAVRSETDLSGFRLRWLLLGVLLTLGAIALGFAIKKSLRHSARPMDDVIASDANGSRERSQPAGHSAIDADSNSVPKTGVSPQIINSLPKTSFDRLTETSISPYERRVAFLDAGYELPGLVGVIGDSRLKHWGRVLRTVFSEADQLVVSLGNDQTLRVWKCDSGDLLQTIHLPATSTVNSIALVLNGQRVLIGFGDGRIAAFGIHDGQQSWERVIGEGDVLDFAVTNQGESVWAALSASKQLKLIDAATGETGKTLSISSNPRRLRANSAGTQFAVSLSNGKIEVYGIETTQLIKQLAGHQHAACSLDFSPSGEELVSASIQDREFAIWSLAKPESPQRISTKEDPHAVAFLSSSTQVLVASGWGLSVVDLTKTEPPKLLHGHYGIVRDLAISTKLNLFASASDDHQLAMWQLPTMKRAFLNEPQQQSLKAMSLDTEGRHLAIGDYGQVRLWDVTENRLSHRLSLNGGAVAELSVSPNGEQVAVASVFEPEVSIWSNETGKEVGRIRIRDNVTSLAFSPDSKVLACGYRSRNSNDLRGIVLIDAARNEIQRELPTPKECNTNNELAWSDDGKRLLSCESRSVALWEVDTGSVISRLKIDGLQQPRFRASALDATGQRAFVATTEGRVFECDFKNESVREFFKHERGCWIDSLAISPDRTSLLMATKDGRLRMRSLGAEASQTTRSALIGPGRGTFRRVAFSRDGKYIVTGNSNGTVYVLKTADLKWE